MHSVQFIFSYFEISDLLRRDGLLATHCFLLHSANSLQMDIGIDHITNWWPWKMWNLAFKQCRKFQRVLVVWYWNSLWIMSTYIWWFLYAINKYVVIDHNSCTWRMQIVFLDIVHFTIFYTIEYRSRILLLSCKLFEKMNDNTYFNKIITWFSWLKRDIYKVLRFFRGQSRSGTFPTKHSV